MKDFKFMLIAAALLTQSTLSFSQNTIVPYNTTIERLLTSKNFGECMFEPTIGPDQVGMDCKNQWVTVDCAAVLPVSTKSVAAGKWSTIQLAYATGKEVRVRIDPNVAISGWCWLEQVQTCPDGGCPDPQPPVTPES